VRYGYSGVLVNTMDMNRLTIILKFAGVYMGLFLASFLVYKGIEIGNTIFMLVAFMIRDLYRSETGKEDK